MTAPFVTAFAPPMPCDPADVVVGDRLLTSTGWVDVRAFKTPRLWVPADSRRVRPEPGVPVLIQRLVHIPQAA